MKSTSQFLALALLLLPACNTSRKPQIAVIPKATSHMFWISVEAGANKAGKDFNVDILWNGAASETDYSRQIQIVDAMIARHVDGIAVAASDVNILDASLERAWQQKIPVTVFDSGVASDKYMTFVATNNYEAGKLAGRKLAALIGGKGSVGLVAHAPGSNSTGERERGFEDVLQQEFPNIKIVGRQFGMSDRSKSMAATENILTANPDLDGIFASSEPSSTGAALAIKARGLSGKVKFVAFDSTDVMVQDLRDGVITAMTVQDPFQIGYQAVKTLVDKLHGKTPPRHMDLSAIVVTREDLDKPEIRALLFPAVRNNLP